MYTKKITFTIMLLIVSTVHAEEEDSLNALPNLDSSEDGSPRILTSAVLDVWGSMMSLLWPGPLIQPIGEVHEEGPAILEFGYGPDDGPATWAADFPLCGGARQSPINLMTGALRPVINLTPLSWTKSYSQTPVSMTLHNNGKAYELSGDWGTFPRPELSGGPLQGGYTFLQMHFHWGADNTRGSEHTIDGKSFPLELHVVHYKTEYGTPTNALTKPDGLAVVGYLFHLSAKPGATVRTLIQGISVLREPETEVAASPVAFSAFLNPPKSYINYLGSLTTPLCGESVVWIVSTKTLPVSSEQLASFRTLHFKNGQPMVDNFRPVQPLNGRSMYYYTSLL